MIYALDVQIAKPGIYLTVNSPRAGYGIVLPAYTKRRTTVSSGYTPISLSACPHLSCSSLQVNP
jgi:hypothetical protein